MVYADYDFYIADYKGSTVPADQFDALAQKASAYIDYITMNRAKNAAGAALYAVQNAVCALAEVMADEAKMDTTAYSTAQPVASETVGGWSRSYGTRTVSTVDAQRIESRKRETAAMYLAPHGLLYRGGCKCTLPTL